MRQRILITGGSGFIGRNLAELLAEQYGIVAPGRHELDLTNTETVQALFAENRFDVVIHSATGRSNRKVTAPDLFKRNCRMFFNLARQRGRFGKMLYFGSGAEFGVRVPKMSESFFDTHVPGDDYGLAKYVAAQYTEAAASNIYNLRLFGVFGKYEAWDVRFISNAICRALFNLPIVIRQNVCFDYLYVKDLAHITSWFIEHEPKYRTYNVCRGETYELLRLAGLVTGALEKNCTIRALQPGLAPEYSGDNRRLLDEMKGFAFTPIEEAVRELADWYRLRRAEINEDALRFDG